MKKITKYPSKSITSSIDTEDMEATENKDLSPLSTELWDVADRLHDLLDVVPYDILFDDEREVISKSIDILKRTSDYIDYEM